MPLDAATVEGDTIRVPYDKDRIKGAPHYEAGVPLTESDEQELYSYYGLGGRTAHDTVAAQSGTPTGTPSCRRNRADRRAGNT